MIFRRCDRGEPRVLGAQEVVAKDWDKSNAELIEMDTKKAALISAVTTYISLASFHSHDNVLTCRFRYGDITPSKSSRVFDSRRDHPDDCGPEGFFKMTLRYGDMQFMEAIGKVPRKSSPFPLLELRLIRDVDVQSRSISRQTSPDTNRTTRSTWTTDPRMTRTARARMILETRP